MAIMQHKYVLMDYDSGENPAENHQAERVQLIPLEQDDGPAVCFVVVTGVVGEGGSNFEINTRGNLPDMDGAITMGALVRTEAGPVYAFIDMDGHVFPDQAWVLEAEGDTIPPVKMRAVLYSNWQFKVVRTPVS